MSDGSIIIDSKIDSKQLEKDLKDIQSKIKSAGDNIKKIGSDLTKHVTLPIVGLGGLALAAANDIDKAYKTIQIGTGATGKDLEALHGVFDDLFTQVPQGADEVASAIANLNTFTGATDQILQDLTKSVLDASRMLGEDGVGASEAYGKAMNQWQIPVEEGVGHLDHLMKLTQDFGVSLTGLSSQLTAYGPIMKNAGFEMNEAAHFMAILESNGISVSRVMPALNQSFRNWAAEGKDSRKEFEKVIKTIEKTEDSQKALALATEVFGAQGAQRLMTAIRNGVIPSFEDLGGMFDESSGLIDELGEDTLTMSDRFAMMKNEVTMALQPIGEILLQLAEEWIPILTAKIAELAEWWQNLSPHTQQIILILTGLAAALGPVLMIFGMFVGTISKLLPLFSALLKFLGLLLNPWVLIGAAVAALAVLIYKYWDEIKAFTEKVWNGIVDFVKGIWEGIKNTASTVFGAIRDFFSNIWNGIRNIFTNTVNRIRDTISSVFGQVRSIVESVFGGIRNFFSSVWDSILSGLNRFKNMFLRVWEGIKSGIRMVVNPIGAIMNGLLGGIESMVNAIARAINALPSFSIPSWVPGIGGGRFGLPTIPTISLPRIPSLDIGTDRVLSDGLAMIHAGEAIVPAEVVDGGFTGGNSKKPAVINLVVNSEVFASVILDDIKALLGDDVELTAYLGGDR